MQTSLAAEQVCVWTEKDMTFFASNSCDLQQDILFVPVTSENDFSVDSIDLHYCSSPSPQTGQG